VAPTPILQLLRAWDGEAPFELPDEPPLSEGALRFASGALDGFGVGEEEALDAMRARVECALEQALRDGSAHGEEVLLETLGASRALLIADALSARLATRFPAQRDALAALARRIVTQACDREALKLGAVLLGEVGVPADVPVLEEIARHDEFTLYAASAVGRLLEDPRDAWWRMARRVRGWGKIQVVQRLAPRVEDRADLRAWLLREGCANDVMPEYLAFLCAHHGRLAEALEEGPVDEALLDGAVLIAQALLNGGPAEDLDDLDQGARLLRALARTLEPRCQELERLSFFFALRTWLEWPKAPAGGEALWEARARRGFTRAVRAELAWACDRVRAAPWREEVLAAVEDPARRVFAWALAEWVDVDLWTVGLAQLSAQPLDDFLWYRLLQTDAPDRFDRLIRFAEEVLPLEAIATGPAHALGFGQAFAPHACLDFVLQGLKARPVACDGLLAAALRSPVVRNRNGALAVLEAQPSSVWGARTRSALAQTLRDEPREDVLERLRRLALPTVA
jgi:hypothetical protein